MLRIRHRRRDSRKIAKVARALALLDVPPGILQPAPRRSVRISL